MFSLVKVLMSQDSYGKHDLEYNKMISFNYTYYITEEFFFIKKKYNWNIKNTIWIFVDNMKRPDIYLTTIQKFPLLPEISPSSFCISRDNLFHFQKMYPSIKIWTLLEYWSAEPKCGNGVSGKLSDGTDFKRVSFLEVPAVISLLLLFFLPRTMFSCLLRHKYTHRLCSVPQIWFLFLLFFFCTELLSITKRIKPPISKHLFMTCETFSLTP